VAALDDPGGRNSTPNQRVAAAERLAVTAANFVWVGATGIVRRHRRTLMALVEAEQMTLNFPKGTLVAGVGRRQDPMGHRRWRLRLAAVWIQAERAGVAPERVPDGV
jgi:hypothetical protein